MPTASRSARSPQELSHSEPPASDTQSRVTEWCRWQSRLLPQVERLILFQVKQVKAMSGAASTHSVGYLASWPKCQSVESYKALAQRALDKPGGVMSSLSLPGQTSRTPCVAVPVPANAPAYVVVVVTATADEQTVMAVRQLIDWGAYWLREGQAENSALRGQALTRAVLKHDSQELAAQELVTQLALLPECDRASIGWVDSGRIQLSAQSNSTSFDHRMSGVVAIENAMHEAFEQQQTISSVDGDTFTNEAQRALCQQTSTHYCLSIPVRSDRGILAVVTLEGNRPLSDELRVWCEDVLTELATVLELLQRDAQPIMQRCQIRCYQVWRDLTGREHSGRQLAAMAVTVMFLLSLLLEGPHRIAARASIEGSDKQLITAARNGYVQAAYARAGDVVERDQIIARLDNRELLLTQSQWQTELDKLDRSYSLALANSDRTELSLLRAQRNEIQAELKLVEQQLERNIIRAPFAGVLVSGDLNQQLGAPVEPGQTLFEIASLDSYRLLLDVDEHSVAEVRSGQSGQLRLASLPDDVHQLSVLNVLPVAKSKDGKTVFRMQAALNGDSQQLRPGMQGVAKIEVGKSPWLWLWTHRFVRSVRIWFWSIGL